MITDSIAKIVSLWLVNVGEGHLPEEDLENDWPVFIGLLPDDDGIRDNALAVFQTTPVLQGRIQATGETIESYGIQIRIRAVNYSAGITKVSNISNKADLVKNTNIFLDQKIYQISSMNRTSGPLFLGREPERKRRESITVNYLIPVKEISL